MEINGEKFEPTDDLGYPGLAVSKEGHVWSFAKKRLLPGLKSNRGYLRLYIKNKYKQFVCVPIHRLIAMRYIPNPDNKPQVNHIDGNKENNSIENLEWASNLENAHHAMTHGLMPHWKLEEATVHKICQEFCIGALTLREIAKKYNAPYASVVSIKCHRNWTHISKHYPFSSKFERKSELEEDTVHKICKDLEDMKAIHFRCAIIGKKYGVSRDTIQKIVSGKNWRDISSQYAITYN